VSTIDRQGYWLVTADGRTSNFGSAPAVGSISAHLASPIVGAAPTGTDAGLYLVAGDGGVFTLGDAVFQGSLGATKLNAPIVAITADKFFSGGGYTLIAADGGTFAYGTGFVGSVANIHLASPIVAAFSTLDGGGLVLAAADGGIFTLGNSYFWGSLGGMKINAPIVGIAPSADNFGGYRLLGRDGGVYTFGPGVPFLGSLGGSKLNAPVAAIMGA
jgi:hypothetical protein